MRIPHAAALALLLVPAACATPEARVRRSLTDAGVPAATARCMAPPIARRLSADQIDRLESLAGFADTPIGRMTVGEALRRAGALGDPAILAAVTRAAAGCAIAG